MRVLVVLRSITWSDASMSVFKTSFVAAVSAFCVLYGGACSSTPVPDYPFPESQPLEDTELAEFVMDDDDYEDPYAEEEEWDDGLDDVDWSMDGESGDSNGATASDNAASESGE